MPDPTHVDLPAGVRELCDAVVPPDRRQARLAQVRQLTVARPAGSLGRLDDAVLHVAGIRRTTRPEPLAGVVSVLAGDHGVAAHGTSRFRYGLTGRVLALINEGRAPVNRLAARVPARVETADLGLAEPVGDPRYRVAAGTADLCVRDAMTRAETELALANGARYAVERLAGSGMVGVGEIGVGNTTATSALAARLLGVPAAITVGAGSGVDDATVLRKRELIEMALARTAALPDDPLRLLAGLGGLEIAGNVGLILAAAADRRVIVLDGAITAVAALIAVRLCPAVREHLIAGHLSNEPVHRLLLAELCLKPLLSLEMRLGMASGAAMAMALLTGALDVVAATPDAVEAGLAPGAAEAAR
ncbi:nicotinate-nucleotide--dimethylbenzimidazole phosphoribosyltransferase [Actinoplanes sp. NBRC 103695]|uniref:nicotinate-nucleotide--dimethylbenzimidazole phosphoribosyltransferase n=1 Tax=Actinoplanes sp. NBRC 103695 TaxID=3032202 RepID=UPI0024A170F4|nr:nicotinate-nucleotide--dimethylbenzimidazole phosphoribosyltransferase [Actinoplanes sp. NBRC 103695]GLZ01168.1 nicotinate-nucleotide--dimethylbenzimidazole phosphoribosyltransferase [Actinoplanes sp. NBRC 103695]